MLALNQEIEPSKYDLMLNACNEYINKGRPVQHILGYSYFFGYKIKVNNDVLIPRPETEELVGYVLATYDDIFKGKKVSVVDVGTGSGAIALSLAKEEPNMMVCATDISKKALKVAAENCKENNADITLYQGDMLEPLIEHNLKFDILVSNPPYIPNNEYVEDIVINNEPHVALFGGTLGMDFYEKILSKAHLILNIPSFIAFEHSYNKRKEMEQLIKKYFPHAKYETIKDLSGKDRITIIINKE